MMQRWTVRQEFVGANPAARPNGRGRTPAAVSYFKGPKTDWKTGLPTYEGLVYRDLWPGVDLVYEGTPQRLKSTFLIRPGADPNRIRLAYQGAEDVRLNDAGQLEVSTPMGSFRDDRPFAYQEVDGQQRKVSATYTLEADSGSGRYVYGFRLADYDRRRPLVLDPLVFAYAGYIGGSGLDEGQDIAVDGDGNAYVTGATSSADFPATVGPDLDFNGGFLPMPSDVFVAKVKADGTGLVYAGFIGGAGNDLGFRIAVDRGGSAYITGATDSTETSFPVTVGPDLTFNGAIDPVTGIPFFPDAFVAKVNAEGTVLEYAGYIGGADEEQGFSIAVHEEPANTGQFFAFVAGPTRSDETTFPNGNGMGTGPGQFQGPGPDQTFNSPFNPILGIGPFQDAFVVKVKADGTGLVYAGYIGGSLLDFAQAIAVTEDGSAIVGGSTNSDERAGDFPGDVAFPVKTGPDLTFNGGLDPATGMARSTFDAFVAKVKPDGTGLVYCGYIGGSGDDGIFDLALDSAGSAYVTGLTSSDEVDANPSDPSNLLDFLSDIAFPVKVGPDLTFNGPFDPVTGAGLDGDAFVAKVTPDGTGLVYAGYIGGIGKDQGLAIDVDQAGNAYVSGTTDSTEVTFPATVGPDGTFNGGETDAFVAKVKADGTGLVYASYIGGAGSEGRPLKMGLAVDGFGNAYVAGLTGSDETTFPNGAGIGAGPGQFAGPGPDLTYNGGGTDAFVVKIAGTAADVSGTGRVDIAGRRARFSFHVTRLETGGPVQGQLHYENETEGVSLDSQSFSSLVTSGSAAIFAGTCSLNGIPCTFEVTVRGGDRTRDVFAISISGARAEGGAVNRGNIKIRE
jgi:hypothetical protein